MLDINTINDINEITGLLITNCRLTVNQLQCVRTSRKHMHLLLPQRIYDGVYNPHIDERKRLALVKTLSDKILSGDYTMDDSMAAKYYVGQLQRRLARVDVYVTNTANGLCVTIGKGGEQHLFKPNELYKRDAYALKYVLDTVGIEHAILH